MSSKSSRLSQIEFSPFSLETIKVDDRLVNPAPKQTSQFTCVQRVRNCFARLREEFHTSWMGKIYYQYDPYRPLGISAFNFISNTLNISSLNGVFNLYKLSATRGNWESYTWFEKIRHVAKVCVVVSIPFALIGIGLAIRDLLHKEDALSALFKIAENMAYLSSSVGTLISGLFALGIGVAKVLIWAFAFYAAGAVLSLASTGFHARVLKRNQKFLLEIEEGKNSAEAWSILSNKTPEQVSERLNLPAEIMQKFYAQFDEQNVASPGLKSEAIRLIKARIHNQISSEKVLVISSLVSSIGMLVLLFTPLFPLAYAFLAFSACLSIINFYNDRKSLLSFKAKLLAASNE